MEEIILRDDFIKLGQAIKAAGLVESGVEARLLFRMVKLRLMALLKHSVEKNFLAEKL